MACVYIGPDHRPLVFFLPYNMDDKELSALQEDAPSRGLRVTHSFSKKDVEIVISNQLHFKWQVFQELKEVHGLKGYWGGKCVHLDWYLSSFRNGNLTLPRIWPYLLCYKAELPCRRSAERDTQNKPGYSFHVQNVLWPTKEDVFNHLDVFTVVVKKSDIVNTVLPATPATEGLNNPSPIEVVDNRDLCPNLADPNITLLPPSTDEAVPNVVTQNERKAPSSIPSSSSIETSNSRDDLVVTLPNLVGVLQLARDEKRLRSGSVYHEFVRLHAVHYNFFASDGLGNGEKKKVLDCYIKMIVTEYPQIKEDITAENPSGYRFLKDDIYNSARNMRSYRSRKEKRFENTIVPTAGSSRQSVKRPRECSSSRPVSEADFEKRRFIVQANPTLLMNEIVSLIPHYATFDSVVAEFLMMPVMKNYDYGGFSTLFNKLVITFKEYLNKTHSTVPHYTEQFTTLDVLEAINKEASTGRGQPKYNALFTKKQVGDLIESAGPEPVKADIPQSPRCDVFFSENGNLHSILIYGSGGYKFAVKNVDTESKIFFSLLAVHYIFDLIYPTPYGLLQVLDTYLLQRFDPRAPMEDVSNQPLKKKTATPGKKGKKTTSTVGRFIDKFNMHLKTSAIHVDSNDCVNDATTDD